MSLLNIFRPKWQHSEPEVRVQAILALGPENQDIFETAVTSDENPEVRSAAVRKLTSITFLREILLKESDTDIKRLAETRMQEEIIKTLKGHRIPATQKEFDLLSQVANTRFVEDLLRNMPSSELRLALVNLCSKQGPLAQTALKDAKEEIAQAALARVESESLLQDIFQNSRHTSVRQKAGERLKKARESKDNGENATMLLFRKREALVQQAKRLADDKKFMDKASEFAKLMIEAQGLGMGPAQADLDALYQDFQEKCAAEVKHIEAEEQAREAKKSKHTSLLQLLEEFEMFVNEDKVQDNMSRIKNIIEQWKQNGGNEDTQLAKRYASAFSRFQRALATLEETQVSQQSVLQSNASREEILEQLKLLTDKEASETLERQVKGLTRNWESLPLLEGEDPQLQTYNVLRDQLSQKLNAMSDELRKSFEEKTTQLKAIIESIKQIDENEDFREIAKMLSETYRHWKEIVGEDKYRYQEIWKEYREATSRFQEMQQWESWHNERDREAILEEMTLLAKEEASKEVLFKLRNLSTQWKSIGPVATTRINEFRDNFRNLFEEIMSKCAPLVEEQNAERQKNLEEKEKLCAQAELLASDTADNWKDKYKTMQQLQEDWKAVGQVPKENNQPLWDRFRAASNIFYTQHKEFLKKEDGERQKNYEKKVLLCEKAEQLKESTDWNGTSNKLKQLQEEWKETGPAPKSLSEEIWTRFRTACDAFFELKRAHFEEMDEVKEANLAAKEALCARLEALDLDPNNAETVQAVQQIETEWKAIGMVPRNNVDSLWDRFCASSDKFLDRRAASDPAIKAEIETAKKQKEAMLEQVVTLTNNAGANQSADAVRALQPEWKNLPRCGTEEQELYRRFREACDDFFNSRRDQLEIQEQARENNLQKKKMLCEQAEQLLEGINNANLQNVMNEVKHLRRLWKEIGAVPREHSDKIWARFNAACDAVFAKGRTDSNDSKEPQA